MQEQVNLVSLGDSIATGTQTPFSRVPSYVHYLWEKMRGEGYVPRVYNLANDGDATRDLLRKINHSARFGRIIEQADFITVSIGGNDLMEAMSVPGFASINLHKASRGQKSFEANWPLIAEAIRDINGKARLVVLSIYNPYNASRYLERRYACDRNLCETTDRLLEPVNGTIAARAPNGYRVADVYAAFRPFSNGRMHRVSCLYQNSMPALRNPHPTSQGQRMIADLVFEQLHTNSL